MKPSFLFVFFLLAASLVLAHAEVIKVIDENNFVSFYAVPLSPLEGEKVSFLIGFVENFSISKQKIFVNYSVVDLAGEKTVFEKNFVEVRGGVSSLDFVFEKQGLYELRVSYQKESEPQKVFSTDYQVQVRGGEKSGLSNELVLSVFFSGVLAGALLVLLAKRFPRF